MIDSVRVLKSSFVPIVFTSQSCLDTPGIVKGSNLRYMVEVVSGVHALALHYIDVGWNEESIKIDVALSELEIGGHVLHLPDPRRDVFIPKFVAQPGDVAAS